MSVFWKRRQLHRAVEGELSAAEEEKLRTHLSGCAGCAAYYERLTLTRRALAGGPELEDARALRRLEAALDVPRALAPARRGSWKWAMPVPVGLALAGLLLFVVRAPEDDAIGWRGQADAEVAAQAQIWVYAHSEARGLRLVAELPFSGEGELRQGEAIQFTYRHAQGKKYLWVLGLDAEGKRHVYYPQAGAPVPLSQTATPLPLGRSVRLSTHPPGVLKIVAVFSESALSEAQLDTELQKPQHPSALFQVEP
jgi:hypothetical protein